MDQNKHRWQERLLGKHLMRCASCETDADDTSESLENASVIALYFSFANINSKSDDLTCKLRDLYEKLNGEGENERRRLEVVQVVLWVNNDVFSDFEASHRECLLGLPWFALPFKEIELKARLSRRYRIKSGVPTLVLLDKDGTTISISAQDKLLEDPHGLNFPWRPRPVDQVLKDVGLIPGGMFYKEHQNTKVDVRYEDIPDGIKGFYFSANWCPPCRAFTPQLVDMYKQVRKKEPNFEIIFVSSDRSAESFSTYIEYMPWLAVPFQQSAVRAELAQLYGIRGIPTLLLLDNNGHVITMDARTELAEDPLVQNFPWKPRAVNVLTERFAAKLQDFPAIVLFVDGEETELHFAESILAPAADAYYKKHNINFNALQEDLLLSVENENYLQFLVGMDSETSDIVRDLVGLDDVVPLLVGIDIPNRRFAVMEYGVELTVDSCSDFVDKFQDGNVKFIDINERTSQTNEEN
ncbi:nucleoredoxin-like [Coccinella septempunctata]|uniref:nucleoredoxin-like n=1 Tax=Coccinella septempunctata TaxID=41139 RepID=UPI001D06BB51|nr:nucleoredoxin-like [Coccinella septempunctata]